LLAEACGKKGQPKKGLLYWSSTGRSEQNWRTSLRAELYRLKGELTLQQEARGWRLETSSSFPQASSLKSQVSSGVKQEAEGSFSRPSRLPASRVQIMGAAGGDELEPLWQQQGKKEEARQMLAEIYGWFTEGFDMKDLQEAKAFLQVLSSI